MLTEITKQSSGHDYVIATPIWKERLDLFEHNNIQITNKYNTSVDKYFIAPESMDCSFYEQSFPDWKYKRISPVWLSSVSAYNSLMLSPVIYELFNTYSYLVICQTDAVLIRDISSLNMMNYDYIGSPWVKPVLINKFKIYGLFYCGKIIDILGFSIAVEVGNGGLSIRKIKKFLTLTRSIPSRKFIKIAEDNFWAYMGYLKRLTIPEAEIAEKIFWETSAQYQQSMPEYLYGFHALEKWNYKLYTNLVNKYLFSE